MIRLDSIKKSKGAVQHSDQMVCERCHQSWDVNVRYEPKYKPVVPKCNVVMTDHNHIHLFNMRQRVSDDGVEKYGTLWMNIAQVASQATTSQRKKVGCAIVTPSMGVYVGYNGTYPNADNTCELDNGETSPETYHAEENALDKMLNEGIRANGSVVYLTLSPCLNCSKRLAGAGVKAVYYLEQYKCSKGVDHLKKRGIVVEQFESIR